jgi:acylphosphatase
MRRDDVEEGDHWVRLHARIHGYVQGVGFRYYVLARVSGSGSGIRGWVRNRADGSVECVAEGPRPRLERLLGELREGPRLAEVSDVVVEWQPARGDLPEFRVAH